MTQAKSTAENTNKVIVIGAGPGGLCMGIKLKEAGINDFVILDKSAGAGGTWYNNTYPGLSCDVPSYLYSLSFEPKRDWTKPYPDQPEILTYLQGVVETYALEPHLRLRTEVRAAHWDEESCNWTVVTDQGEFTAPIVVSAMGMFNRPKSPNIPGINDFEGPLFHTARFNHDCDLSGKTVAIIGSAATAVQMAPEIAKQAAQLYLYQRSAVWVMPKDNEPFSEEQLANFRENPQAALDTRQEIFEAIDPNIVFDKDHQELIDGCQALCMQQLEAVQDPQVRSKLVPEVSWGTHRPLSANDWFPMFNQANVELVTDPIEKITRNSIENSNGESREIDVIITATGYHTTEFLSAIEVTGREGLRLADAWRDGAQAYLGVTTAGFPNIFMIYGPNTNNGSLLVLLEAQVDYIMRQLKRMEDESLAWMDVRREAMDSYNETIQRELNAIEVWRAPANNYYHSDSGRNVTQWPNSMSEFERRTAVSDPDAYEVG